MEPYMQWTGGQRTVGVQKDCAAELAAGELGADFRCLMPRHDLGRIRLVGVDVADEPSAGEVDLCIAAPSTDTDHYT